jgi:hypothetical protein
MSGSGKYAVCAGVAAASAIAIAGCPAVPDIYFVSDASIDAPEPVKEGGPDDRFVPDGNPGGCLGTPPTGGTSVECCGGHWCVDCNPQKCIACAGGVCGSMLCCGKGGPAVTCEATRCN